MSFKECPLLFGGLSSKFWDQGTVYITKSRVVFVSCLHITWKPIFSINPESSLIKVKITETQGSYGNYMEKKVGKNWLGETPSTGTRSVSPDKPRPTV